MSQRCFVLLTVLTFFTTISCKCRESYMTFCDNFGDLRRYKNFETMKFLQIGSEFRNAKLEKVNLDSKLSLARYYKLENLFIVGVIDELLSRTIRCVYTKLALRNLHLYGNNIKSLSGNQIPDLPLKTLSLTNNKIETITTFALSDHDIEELDLSDNLLEEILENSLPYKYKTKSISIKNNKLTHIEPNSLPSSLISLKLDGNEFRFLQAETLNSLVNLQELTLSQNKFRSIPHLDQLVNLLVLDMSSNEIEKIRNGSFKNLDKLEYLDLSNNKISSYSALELLLTAGKQKSLTVSLALNFFDDLYLDKISLEQQKFVLYGNPWNCNSWSNLKTKLNGHESDCDLEFQANGRTPYCINYIHNQHNLYNNTWGIYADRLRKAVIKSQENSDCMRFETKNDILYRYTFSVGCVL